MKIGLVGPSYQQRSLPFDAQRTINFFPVFDEQGKEVASLYGTPGLKPFAEMVGNGPIRGNFTSSNGRCFQISGDKLYEVEENGDETLHGTLNTASGNVTIDENTTQLGICDGTDIYIFTYATDTFQEVTDTDAPSPAATLTYLDGYFIVNKGGTGQWYISALNNGLAWDALDFATAESSPDELLRVIRAVGQLWLLGNKTTEIWTNTGDAAFPFTKISGTDIAIGIMAAHTALEHGNTLFWVGRDDKGEGIVYAAEGFRPKQISTEAIEIMIKAAPTRANMRAMAYQQDGHIFYMLTGGGLETSLVNDLKTELWHERAYLNAQGEFEQHLASCCTFAFGKHLVGDRRNGNIYELDIETYSDNGDEIACDRIYTHLSNEDERVRYKRLVIGVEAGVGLQFGQGEEPALMVRFSKDGGRTWGDWYTVPIGRVGEYKNKAAIRRIGIAEQLTIHTRITDPVKRAITGSYMT